MSHMSSIGRFLVAVCLSAAMVLGSALSFAGPSFAVTFDPGVSILADGVRHEIRMDAAEPGTAWAEAFVSRAATHDLYCSGGFVLELGAMRS